MKKALRQLGLITRTLSYQAPISAKKTAYLALVRSVLDYGSSLWTPHTKELIKTVEAVQLKATNFILCNPRYNSPNHIDYKTRLLTLNLLPTTFRKEFMDITLFLKSIHGQTNLDIEKYINFTDWDIGPCTRALDHLTRLKVPQNRLDSTSRFFPYHISRLWNSLPNHIRIVLRHTQNPLVIKQHLTPYYKEKLANTFDTNNQCTWISWCGCGCCRP